MKIVQTGIRLRNVILHISTWMILAFLSSLAGSTAGADDSSLNASRQIAKAPGLDTVGAVIASAVEKGAVAGAVVHVSQAGRPLIVAAFGQADPNRKMTTDTIFRIASMSKPMTSVAVMMLVEEGKIGLDDPLARFIPEFSQIRVVGAKADETIAPTRAVTIRDLLSHTSGIAYGLNPPELLRTSFRTANLADGLNRRDPTLAENIRELAHIPLAHQPGTAFTYGMNTDVLGRVVEIASALPFDQFLTERIFKPLNMSDTGFCAQRETFAAGRDLSTHCRRELETVAAGRSRSRNCRRRDVFRITSGGADEVFVRRGRAGIHRNRLRSIFDDARSRRTIRRPSPASIRFDPAMTTNQIGNLSCSYAIHGDKFGLGFGVTTQSGATRPSVHIRGEAFITRFSGSTPNANWSRF